MDDLNKGFLESHGHSSPDRTEGSSSVLPGIKSARDVLESHLYFEDILNGAEKDVQGSPSRDTYYSFVRGDSVLKLPPIHGQVEQGTQ
jgi:hypothetical protein